MYSKDKYTRRSTPREITKVICILSSSCNKRQAGSMYSTCFMQQTQTVNHHALRCRICCLMVARDDRLIFVTDPLHLLPKTACLCFKKMLLHAWRGGKGKNGKNVLAWSMGNSSIVCNHSHIPKQCGPPVIPAKERRRVILLSHHWQ